MVRYPPHVLHSIFPISDVSDHPRHLKGHRGYIQLAVFAIVVAVGFSGCSSNAPADEGSPTPTPAAGSETTQSPSPVAPTVTVTAQPEENANVDDGDGAPITGIAKDSQMAWVSCDAPEQMTDHVGNTFVETFCTTSPDEPVSFYEYSTDETLGMLEEYTDTTYVSPKWAVAATSTEQLTSIVTNLKDQGYEGFAQFDTADDVFPEADSDVLSDGGHRAFLAIAWSQSAQDDKTVVCDAWDGASGLVISELMELNEIAVSEELMRAFYDEKCMELEN